MLDPNKAVEQMQSEFSAAFQAGAASRDAEVVSLTNQRDYEYVRAENAEQERAQFEQESDQLREQAKMLRDFIASAQVSSGVCCCGEAMDGHSSPMSCGHSPVDMWDHAVEKLLHAPSDTSTPEQSLAASELRKERDALQADNAELVAVLELLSKYIAYNGDDWVQRTALEALAKVRKP